MIKLSDWQINERNTNQFAEYYRHTDSSLGDYHFVSCQYQKDGYWIINLGGAFGIFQSIVDRKTYSTINEAKKVCDDLISRLDNISAFV